MRVAKQVPNLAVLTAALEVSFFRDFGKLGSEYEQRPDEDDRAQDKVGDHDSHGLCLQVRIVPTGRLQGVDLLGTQFDP